MKHPDNVCFEAPVGGRILGNYICPWEVTLKGSAKFNYWWSYDKQKFVTNMERSGGGHSTHVNNPPQSYRAFLRFCRKHGKYLETGTEIVFLNRFQDHNIIYTV